MAQDTIKKLIESLDNLLEEPQDLKTLALHYRHHIATNLLSGLEEVLRTLALAMPKKSFTHHSPKNTGKASSCPRPQPWTHPTPRAPNHVLFLSELSLMIQEQGNGNVTMGQSHARMLLNWSVAAGSKDSGNSRELEGAPVGAGRRSWDVANGEVPNM